ncbi:hypothetical protein A3C87_01920 [Candidatus Kaiserbacteria bacterium RIFCSPHIGHO2_02_FULL_49_34]|uniref:Uncharacterized protein n=1 Tax=Candidatus Kaiserbacteria bacterium RIFCSPHIGHO2_02_FULL_49_34 TaxID=1798491 RepID=A0A1F6DI86_9BACT|nr:MAG: hypothetical protein A3C87_01920 [Candidatus Kaiserbacteria bacterium RIFCSPHIGHO2_02_FULL_49_34]
MIPRSRNIAITVAVAIALLAGLLFARSATGRTDNIAAGTIFVSEVIAPTSTPSAAPASESATTVRESMRATLIEEIRTAQ